MGRTTAASLGKDPHDVGPPPELIVDQPAPTGVVEQIRRQCRLGTPQRQRVVFGFQDGINGLREALGEHVGDCTQLDAGGGAVGLSKIVRMVAY